MAPNLLLFLIAAVLNCTLLIMTLFPLQEAGADTTGNEMKTRITIHQKGNGNSASISQSGNTGKGKAAINITGKNNRVSLHTDNQSLRADANFRGHSNILLWKPEISNQLFSIRLSAGLEPSNSQNIKEFYFIFDNVEEELMIYQTSDNIISNH